MIKHFQFDPCIENKIIEDICMIEQKGMHLNPDFYFVMGKQCRTENAYTGYQYNKLI